MEAKNKKHRVFRKNYDLLKNGFGCTEVSALLYSKELIGPDVRDSKSPDRILSAVEKVMIIRDNAWDILINEVLVEPPLDNLAAILVRELEEMPDHPSALAIPAHSEPSTKRSVGMDHSSQSPVHPVSLTFNNMSSDYSQIDSGNYSSDKSYFPFDYFQNGCSSSVVPSVPAIMESPDISDTELSLRSDKPANDSGIQSNYGEEEDNNDKQRTPSSSEPESSCVPELDQSNSKELSRSEMVNPHKSSSTTSNKDKRKTRPPSPSHQQTNLTLLKLKNENTSLKDMIEDMKTENDELKSELDTVHTKKTNFMKILEGKLQQLAKDNNLLSQQIEEKRHLEDENRQLTYSVKKMKREIDRCNRDNKQMKSCLELAERNARIQSVTIDKLRDRVSSQDGVINEYKRNNRYNKWLPTDTDDTFDCCYTDNNDRSQNTTTRRTTSPSYY